MQWELEEYYTYFVIDTPFVLVVKYPKPDTVFSTTVFFTNVGVELGRYK